MLKKSLKFKRSVPINPDTLLERTNAPSDLYWNSKSWFFCKFFRFCLISSNDDWVILKKVLQFDELIWPLTNETFMSS